MSPTGGIGAASRWPCLVLACLALGGCQGGTDTATPSRPAEATLLVTEGFGRATIGRETGIPIRPGETALSLLTRFHRVTTHSAGEIVATIDGHERVDHPSGDRDFERWVAEGGRLRGPPPTDRPREFLWVLNVNGIESDTRPAEHRVRPGDVVQFDLRDWYVTLDVRATVGALPQPFVGARHEPAVRCATEGAACGLVRDQLIDARRRSSASRRSGPVTATTVLVGTWRDIRGERWADWLARGPAASGVFARFADGGRRLALFDWDARERRRLGPGTGLLAAIRPTESELVWIVTGVDAAGVEGAATALAAGAAKGAFAVAVRQGERYKLPLPPPS